MATRIRRNVWGLPAGDLTLSWYARAVGIMQSRPLTDPTSWRYQAAIHEYRQATDPLATPGEAKPSAADQLRFWTRCQHGSWFFLPWHRMYLGYFEKIVLEAIKGLGGPADWALPYWNYSDPANLDARRIPLAFRGATLANGSPNPLFVAQRVAGGNAGNVIAQQAEVDLACLTNPVFTALANGGSPGFGGPRTGFEHSGGVIGDVENVPHGSMHVAVGGFQPRGWMSSFSTAALDPLFWLHHSNIDRLWVVWRNRNTQHKDPTLAQWLTGVTFEFHDAAGNIAANTSQDVVDTTSALFDYAYDNVSDPIAVPAPPTGVVVQAAGTLTVGRIVPELLGATEAPLVLGSTAARARVPVTVSNEPQLAAAGAEAARLYLNFENVTGESGSQGYMVYLNVPENQRPESHPELMIGLLPMFGLEESSRSDGEHAGSGLQYTFEISRVADLLRDRNDWDSQGLRVTFVPYGGGAADQPAPAAAQPQAAPVSVGRISLYIA